MRKVWTVAVREYRATIRTKSFVIAVVLMPVFMGGGAAVEGFTRGKVDTAAKKLAVLDRSGKLFSSLQADVEERNRKIVDQDGKLTKPKYELTRIDPGDRALDQVRLDLSDRIRRKEYFAFVEIPPDILEGDPQGAAGALRYYSQEPTYEDVKRWLTYVVNDTVRAVRFREAGIDRRIVDHAMAPVEVQNLGLLSRDESGNIIEAQEVNEFATIMVPVGLVMLMWVALMMTTQPLLQGAIEEKSQKISEVLLGSIAPFPLMLGKLIGYVGVAITLVAIYMIGGYFLLDKFGYADLVPFHLIGWFVVYLSLAILMFGSMFLAAGACCNDSREAQNLVLPLMLVMIIPFFCMAVVLRLPNSDFSRWVSLFPPATPMLMIIRLAIPPGPGTLEPVLGILGTLLTTLLAVWAAGRVFRVALLMQGKAPRIGQIVKWVLRG